MGNLISPGVRVMVYDEHYHYWSKKELIELLEPSIKELGLEVSYESRLVCETYDEVTVVFKSNEDMNLYKLAGPIKEGTNIIFRCE